MGIGCGAIGNGAIGAIESKCEKMCLIAYLRWIERHNGEIQAGAV